MLLEELIPGVIFENSNTEYKQQLDRNNIVDWLKTIAGFANAQGGDFYIGVDDKSHTLIGFTREKADQERNYFNNQVNEHLSPRPDLKIEFIRYTIRKSERYIIHISVPVSVIRPVILKYKGIPAIYMRRNGFTNGATYEEIIKMSTSSTTVQYDAQFTDIPYSRNKFSVLLAFCKEHTDGKTITDKAFHSFGFFNDRRLLSNGAALFEDGYHGPKTAILCSVFSGFTKGSQRIVTANHFNGNITETINYMYDFVSQRMNHSIIKLPDRHINVDAYPERALFEAVVNAVAHRDYYLDGTQIQVDMFKDRLEISSPGSFYHGTPIPKTYDLSSIISKRRNEIICSTLVACNVMEAAGTGFDKIAEEYAQADTNHRPYAYSTTDHFTLVLPDLTYTEGIRDSKTPMLAFAPVPNGTAYDGKILSYCYYSARKTADIAAFLGLSNSTYLRKTVLGNLTDKKYLLASKKRNTIYYKTNPVMVAIE